MPKGARKTGGRRRREHRAELKRESRGRPEKTTVLIVGEGQETEPNYFRGLRDEPDVRSKFAVTVKKGHGFSPEAVVEEALKHKGRAEERRQEYDEVWCVLDVEGPEKRDSLNKAAALAEENDINLCLSNPCFEIWLLSHFARRGRSYRDCAAVIVELSKHWQDHCNCEYRKNDEQIYVRICDLTSTAIANAQWVRETHHTGTASVADANSSTEVYLLVKRLTDVA